MKQSINQSHQFLQKIVHNMRYSTVWLLAYVKMNWRA